MKKLVDFFSKKTPEKNYYVVMIVSVIVVILTLTFRNVYLNYLENYVNISHFSDKSINQINTDDFDFALSEVSEGILYVSYTNEDLKNVDRKIYRLLKKKSLIDKVIYWNVDDLQKDSKYLSMLRSKFPEISGDISLAPLIIYIKDGKAVDVICSEYELINANLLDDMIEEYGIE
jgi:hypothetical protein